MYVYRILQECVSDGDLNRYAATLRPVNYGLFFDAGKESSRF